MTNAIDMQLVADFGGTMFWPVIVLSNIAPGLRRTGYGLPPAEERPGPGSVPSCIPFYLGVTEPAIFIVNLKAHLPGWSP